MTRRFTAHSRTPWRDEFAKSQALRARHGRYDRPVDPDQLLAEVRRRMRVAEQVAADQGLPRPCWCFRPQEVGAIDFDGNGQVLFRLHDGRVFDDAADPRIP